MSQAISTIKKLRKIDLSDNNVGAEAAEVLANALKLQVRVRCVVYHGAVLYCV